MSGICTIIFFLITGGRVPSYLGSSFAFIGVVAAATGHITGSGANPNLAVALGGIVACGILCLDRFCGHALQAHVGLKTHATCCHRRCGDDYWSQPCPVTIKGVAGQPFEMWMALITVLSMGIIAVFTKGLLQRLLLLLVGLLIALRHICGCNNILGFGKPIDFSPIAAAPWFGIPTFHTQLLI